MTEAFFEQAEAPTEAEFTSHCDWCDAEIEVGEHIGHDDHFGWCHADCAVAATEEF